MIQKKQQSRQEARAKVDSGLNRVRKQDQIQKRPESAVQSQSGEKELESEQNFTYQTNIQDKMNTIVQDYLIKQNLIKTLEQFENESQYNHQRIGNQQEYQMLQYFDKGDRDNFLRLWNQNLPQNNKQDYELWKLEFYIQIYFLIYPIHPYLSKKGQIDKQSINAFKQFLDSKGEDLSKTNEVLPFYALPYVQQPQKHQTFQHLFTNQWVEDLKERLKDFTSSIFQNEQITHLQKLVQHYENQHQQTQQHNNYQQQDNSKEIKRLNDQILKLQNDNNEIKQKLNQQVQAYQELNSHAEKNFTEAQQKWFSLCKELMVVSKDLQRFVDNNQSIQNQQKISNLKKKLLQYEKFLNQDFEDLVNKSQDISLFEKASMAEQEISHITNNQQLPTPIKPIQVEEYVPLNYPKIIQLFTKSNNYQHVANVLQALRWRITRAKNALQRRQVVVAYATHDIIGTHSKNILLAQYLILKSHNLIQCQTLKLLNALASDYHGRSYLTLNPTLIKFLVDLIKKEQSDSLIRKNAIGALQKMSLRKQSQTFMLDNNIIYHTLIILKNEQNNLSEYTYEYITALIMNLSLSTRGKDELIQHKELAFDVLYDLIEYPNDQIRTFTNGTFYSLFSRKTIRDYAYSLGIPQELPRLLENSDEKFKKQIQYMIAQLQADEDDYDQSQMEEENDVDDIEDEEEECIGDDDEEDDLNNQDNIIGEELLQKDFELLGDEAENQKLVMDSIILKEVQQRNAQQEQIRESQLERMPVGQIPFYNDTNDKKYNQKLQQHHNQQKQLIQGQGQQNINHNDLQEFASKPKIPRTPPGASKK
ncbi:unnamed protein product [Paramecium sonneborni]|uniref:LisH domain-containing protein ARMC9 n=1 Tax=Paramecium sonneborni TaxID=65129 RepID=A0A8S1KTU4_9CILI|nr:unnamed protein product [Paramecium sonneborni]